ncbi:iron uptake system protein EfeO [Microbacterium trichothecenolyticum]|uniref:Iron uptake system component EfeO n=1 Tax=Microbacterium trichothecenolyticum TaxID=69370 RepID=A0ABU0TSU2_MICTR|nr:iron uptake system protein EfeO [Microbacterium trichothecenolyticum]MDQ1122737.1 iron uptake system component EfeO [Microbacterium trichothecenolyticum]
MSSRTRIAARSSAIALLAVGGLALAGCSGTDNSAPAAAPTNSSGATQVTITLTGDDGDACALDFDTAPAGPITFTVVNKSSTAITEVELQSKSRILGEKENLAPGLPPVSFTTRLDGGTYQVYCPGATNETTDFTVTGESATATGGSVSALLEQGTQGYADYTKGVVADMVTAVTNLQSAVDSGDVQAAQKQYALARPFYEKIESDVEGFVLDGFDPTDNAGNLDYLIDMREATPPDPAVGWSGFHAIERDLFQDGTITDSTKTLAAGLVENTQKLQTVMGTLTYKPEDLANGAAALLEEVQSAKITGEEEAYSHIDLVDFAANVEGAQQAFAFLRPGLDQIDSGLSTQIAGQFDTVTKLLDGYRDPNGLGGYKRWDDALRASDAVTLGKAVQALQEPLSRIAEKVATAS